MKILMIFLILYSTANAAAVESCEITTTRYACPGKDAETFRPYKGINPTKDRKNLNSELLCLKFAEKSSKIIRRGVLQKKEVTVKFQEKDLGKVFSDESECL